MSNAFDVIDFRTAAGANIKRIVEDRIAELARSLESTSASERETQTIRGGILELRKLIREAPQVLSSPNYSNLSRFTHKGGV